MIYYQQGNAMIHNGDCLAVLRTLPDESVHCCVTSPPYWGLRDYGHEGQIGLEETPEAYVSRLVEVFREVRRVLRSDGTLWLNLGDSYASGKQLVGIPWRVAFALQADGWWLRQDIIWHKPNPMPESVRDRCTKAHEYVFLMAKSERYYYDAEAVAEAADTAGKIGGFTPNAALAAGKKPSGNMIAEKGASYVRPDTRNRRSVWTVSTKPYAGAHFATMPPDLVEPCILAGCPDRCCPACGKGFEQLIEKGKSVVESSENRFATNKKRDDAYCRNDGGTLGNMNGKIWAQHKAANPDKFLGWEPACNCAASGTIPGTVLDPFNGAATVGLVSLQLQRRYIGIELNPDYCKISVDRINMEARQKRLFAASCDS